MGVSQKKARKLIQLCSNPDRGATAPSSSASSSSSSAEKADVAYEVVEMPEYLLESEMCSDAEKREELGPRRCNIKGTGMRATRNIRKGERILTETPLFTLTTGSYEAEKDDIIGNSYYRAKPL